MKIFFQLLVLHHQLYELSEMNHPRAINTNNLIFKFDKAKIDSDAST